MVGDGTRGQRSARLTVGPILHWATQHHPVVCDNDRSMMINSLADKASSYTNSKDFTLENPHKAPGVMY